MKHRASHLRVTVPEIARMSVLREAGLSHPAIATVLRIDTGKGFNAEHVRDRLNRYVPDSRKSPRGVPFNGPPSRKVAA